MNEVNEELIKVLDSNSISILNEYFFDELGIFIRSCEEILLERSIKNNNELMINHIQEALSPYHFVLNVTDYEYEIKSTPIDLRLYIYIDALKFVPRANVLSQLLYNCCDILFEMKEEKLFLQGLRLLTIFEDILTNNLTFSDLRNLERHNYEAEIPTVMNYKENLASISYKSKPNQTKFDYIYFEKKRYLNEKQFRKRNKGKQSNKVLSIEEINEQEFWRTLKSLNLLKSKNTDIVTTICILSLIYYKNIFVLPTEIESVFMEFQSTKKERIFEDILKHKKNEIVYLELNREILDVTSIFDEPTDTQFIDDLEQLLSKVETLYSSAITSNNNLFDLVESGFVTYYKNNFMINKSLEISFLPLDLRLLIYVSLIRASDRLITILHLLDRILVTLDKMNEKEVFKEVLFFYTQIELLLIPNMLDNPKEVLPQMLDGSKELNSRLRYNRRHFNSTYKLRQDGLKEALLDSDNMYNQEFWYAVKAFSEQEDLDDRAAWYSIKLFESYFDRIFSFTSEFTEAFELYYFKNRKRKLKDLLKSHELDQIELKFNKNYRIIE